MQWNEFVSRFWICADLCPICVCSMMTFNGWEYCCNRICSLSEPNSFLQPRMALEHNGVLLPYPTYGCNICSESAIFNLHFTFECIDGWFHAQSTLKLNSIVHFSLLIIAYIHRELPFAIACERCIWNNEQHIFFSLLFPFSTSLFILPFFELLHSKSYRHTHTSRIRFCRPFPTGPVLHIAIRYGL